MKLPCWNPREPHEGDMRYANVPRSKWVADIERIKGQAYYQAIADYITNLKVNCETGRGLLLYGTYRSGKSCIAAMVVRELARHRCNPYWLESFELVDGWFKNDNRYDMTRTAHLLVIDDLGLEVEFENNNARKSIINQALRFRLERERATIITTNMTTKKMKETYGEKTMMLLQDFMTPIQIEGINWGKGTSL